MSQGVAGPPPPVPKRLSMSNILHTVKRQVFGAKERTVVQSFEEAKQQFDTFFETLNALQNHLQTVTERYALLATSLSNTWTALGNHFDKSPDPNLTPIAKSGTQKHEHFLQERILVPKSSLTAAANTIGQALITARELIAEMKIREDNLKDYDYYQNKLAELEAERDKTLASGKPIKPKDQEKLDRNVLKTNDSRIKYETHHNQLMERLKQFLDMRTMYVAPVLSSLVSSEQNFINELATAINGIVSRGSEDDAIHMSLEDLERDHSTGAAGPEADAGPAVPTRSPASSISSSTAAPQIVQATEGHSLGPNPFGFGSESKSAHPELDPFAALGTPAASPNSSLGSVPSAPPAKPLPQPPAGALPLPPVYRP